MGRDIGTQASVLFVRATQYLPEEDTQEGTIHGTKYLAALVREVRQLRGQRQH